MDGSHRQHASQARANPGFWLLRSAALGLPLLAFLAGAAWFWREVDSEARIRLARSVDMLHEHALRAFEVQEALLAAIDARLAGLGWAEIAGDPGVRRFLTELDRHTPFTGALALVDPDGRMVLSTSEAANGRLPVDTTVRDYTRAFRDGHAGTFIGEVVVSRPSGMVLFPFARARTGADGRPDGGILVGAYRSEAFEGFYASIAESPGDVITLLRTDGAVLARQPPLGPRIGQMGGGPLLDRVRQANAAPMIYQSRSPLDGRQRLYAMRRIGDYPAAVLYGLDLGVLRASWLHRLATLGAICAGAALLLLALTEAVRRASLDTQAALSAAAAEAEIARAEAERRAAAEQRLRKAERSAALGQVAAGVAHDMNNLVQTVLAAARLLGRRADEPDQVREVAGLLADSAARGQRLAHRMLEFSRTGQRSEARFAPAEALAGIQALLGGLLGSGLRLDLDVPPDLPAAAADRRDFETVLVNLVANARDAMPAGGTVRVEAATEMQGPSLLARPGPWLRVGVVDQGTGMSAEILARAGEPFFTTKPQGLGTGLGLMMARQFAERAGGGLTVASAPGQGTTVTLWLPVAKQLEAAL